MHRIFFVLLITFIISSIGYANNSLQCFENKNYINHNSFEKLSEIKIEIIKTDKWLRNAFAIVRNNGWIKKDLKKNHRANIDLVFQDGFKCSDTAKIRFHGDNPDHYRFVDDINFISSLNVKLLNTNINNITEFKLLLPETRFDEREIIATNLLKKLNFIAPRTKKINVLVNNNKLEYLFQEKISKELIEFNNFPEGPIIEGDQRFYHIGKRNLQLGRVINKKWSSRNWRNAYVSISALSFLNEAYLNFYNNQKNFDIHKMYTLSNSNELLNKNKNLLSNSIIHNFYDDLLIAMGGEHALVPDNRTFYYNYFEDYFYPIYYDGDIKFSNLKIENFNYKIEKNLIIKNFLKINYENLYYINKKSGIKKTHLNDFKLSMKNIFDNLIILNEQEKKNYKNKEPIENKLDNYYYQYSSKSTKLVFYLNYPDIFYICDNSLSNCIKEKLSLKEVGDLLSQNYKKNDNFDYIFVTNDYEKFSKNLSKKLNQTWITQKIDSNFFGKFIKNGISIEVDKNKKKISIKQVNPDGRVFFYSDKKIKDWTIEFKSNFDVDINKTLNKKKNHLDGCITFYGMKFENLNIKSTNGICEDSINFIKSHGSIKKMEVTNSFSDAIDMDFSKIQIDSVKVNKSGNDCMDMSFGEYVVNNLDLLNCKDNGISVGEKSKFESIDLLVKNSENALAVKDSSTANIENFKSINNNFCFRLYNKKKEFDGGTLKVKNLNCDTVYFIDKISKYN